MGAIGLIADSSDYLQDVASMSPPPPERRVMSKAKCKHCGDIIESKSRHDWVSCSCFKNEPDTTGIFIDGGDEYLRCGGNLDNFELIRGTGKVVDFT